MSLRIPDTSPVMYPGKHVDPVALEAAKWAVAAVLRTRGYDPHGRAVIRAAVDLLDLDNATSAVEAAVHDLVTTATIVADSVPDHDPRSKDTSGWQYTLHDDAGALDIHFPRGGAAPPAETDDLPAAEAEGLPEVPAELATVESGQPVLDATVATEPAGQDTNKPPKKARKAGGKRKPGRGGRIRKWDHYVEWADKYQKDNPDKTNGEALREYKRLFAPSFNSGKRPEPKRDTLRKARHYRNSKTTR